MALSLRVKSQQSKIRIRPATIADAPMIVEYLHSEGRKRQFFPQYQADDFNSNSGLLRGLQYSDVLLAFRENELVGTTAAWDQSAFRQWKIKEYSPLFRWLRIPYNMFAQLSGAPRLPQASAALNFFILSLICVRDDDRDVFAALIDETIRRKKTNHAFFLAGMHERDPLLPELQKRRHFSFPSRLYIVHWEDGVEDFRNLDSSMIPYLELGSL